MYVQQMYLNLMEAIGNRVAKEGNVEVGDMIEFETETSPRSPSKGENIIVRHVVTQNDLDEYRKYINAD